MENGPPQPSGSSLPPKPWERAGFSSGPAPFKPPSAGSTSDVVEASETARPGEIVSTANRNTTVNNSTLARPVPTRPWEQQQTYSSSYGGINTGMNYNSGTGTGTGTYGSYGGGYGSGITYGSGLYGNSMYRRGYGGLVGGGMYSGGMYNSGYGGSMGGYGMGGMGMGPYGDQDPNNPYGAPPSPPGFWVSFMHVVCRYVSKNLQASLNQQKVQGDANEIKELFTYRILGSGVRREGIVLRVPPDAFETANARRCNFLWPRCNADRPEYPGISHVHVGTPSGLLYGELARFVLRLLGVKTKANKIQPPGANAPHGPNALPGPHQPRGNQNFIEGPKAAPGAAWNDVWGDNAQ